MSSRAYLLTPLTALLALGCAADTTIFLQNDTEAMLVPYPVVTTPPPPHRAPDPANTVHAGTSRELDTEGFNPLYYSEGRKISLALQFSLDLEPAQILARTMAHQVPPGQEGSDPALQPTLIEEMLFEPSSKKVALVVASGNGFPVTMIEK